MLPLGMSASYGMGIIKKITGSGELKDKTTLIRGVVSDKSKPVGRRNIAGAKVELFNTANSLLFSTPTNTQGGYEIKLKLSTDDYYKVRCSADHFKQAEIYSYINKGRTYNTGFDFYLEPIDGVAPVIFIKPVPSPTNHDVTLDYTASDNVTPANEIYVGGNQSPYTKEGSYIITLTAKDKSGSISTAKVSFVIDKTPPAGVIRVENNSKYTKLGTVIFNLSAQDSPGGSGISQKKFSSDNISWSAPENYSGIKTWKFVPGDGEKRMYVKFSDKA